MMALPVAVETSGRNILFCVRAAVAGGQQMFCGDL